MARGTKVDTAFGLIKTVRRLLPLSALSQRLQQSLRTAKSLSVLALWLPALGNASIKALLRRLQAARQALVQSLSLVPPRQSVDRLRLQQALSAWLKGLLKLPRRLRQVQPPSLLQMQRQALPRLQRFQSLVVSFKAQVHQRQPFHRPPQTAKSSGRKSLRQLIAGLTSLRLLQHIQTSLRPAQAGSRLRED